MMGSNRWKQTRILDYFLMPSNLQSRPDFTDRNAQTHKHTRTQDQVITP